MKKYRDIPEKKFSIPVLMYHHVNPRGRFVTVTPDRFEWQMRYLSSQGFTTLHTDEFWAIMSGQTIPPKKPVLITFDDGWLDNWVYAFPIFKKYGIKAVIFVITSLIPGKGRRKRSDEGSLLSLPKHKECQDMIEKGRASEVMLSWEEIREMTDSGLIEIQSHTHTHQRYDKLYPDNLQRTKVLEEELKTSKELIEQGLNRACNALCWPWGKYNREYVEIARSIGYRMMFTTLKGTNTPQTELWRIKRITIGNIGSFAFRKKLFIHSYAWLSKFYLEVFER
jgi:peptidoglycan/xylan/chitin deacetylase (PgdA/CDA1 family)